MIFCTVSEFSLVVILAKSLEIAIVWTLLRCSFDVASRSCLALLAVAWISAFRIGNIRTSFGRDVWHRLRKNRMELCPSS